MELYVNGKLACLPTVISVGSPKTAGTRRATRISVVFFDLCKRSLTHSLVVTTAKRDKPTTHMKIEKATSKGSQRAMRDDSLLSVDPLRVRSLSLRKRSHLRKYATTRSFDDGMIESTTAHRYVHFVKPKPKKKRGRRGVRFAPLVDVYETELPDDFTVKEYGALWISREDYDEAKKEFTEVIMALQSDVFDSADLFMEESEIPPDHPLRKYCLRGCEKYFDLPTRFKIRQLICERVLEFHRERPSDPEALQRYTSALTAECKDLAFFHGQLNALHCWGRMLQQYQQLKEGLSRLVFTPKSSLNEASCGVEVILDPSAKTGCRALSEIGL